MKRKVFSLMMCLFAFLGMANAQTGNGLTVNPDPIDLGYRPLGAWMRPLDVQFLNEGAGKTITAIEADKTFFVIDAHLPGNVSNAKPYKFTVTHGEAEPGAIQGTLVAMTENRKAFIFDIMAVAYNPIEADVVETAPTIQLPFTATVGEGIYDNYLLPGDKADGKDVVYKLNIEEDVLFSANVEGANGKVALYAEDFNGQPGPGANNGLGGQTEGGGAPFEAQIGEVGTSNSGYFPFYTLYNYSIAEDLFLASELEEAGVTTAPMGSLSWNAKNETGYEQKNISIWMANVSDEVLSSTSHLTSDMTLVFTGDVTPHIGWNEFIFNEGTFAWDGTSNVLICVQRSNGAWNSTINWYTHNPGFVAQAYKYQDSAPYDMENNTYSMSTTTSYRANIIFKSVGRAGRSDQPNASIEEGMTLTPGVYYLAASSTSDEFTVNVNTDVIPMPEAPFNPSPADGQTDVASPVTLAWEFGQYTTGYRVILGTTYPPTNVVVDWTNELSNTLTLNNLYNNKNYFWQVEAMNSTGVASSPIWGFTTALNMPQNLTAENEKIYEGDVLHLMWDNINDRSYRGYNVYQDGVKLNDALVTTTEYNVQGLTYNTTTGYTFNVTAVYDEGESMYSDDLVVLVSGNGNVSGKVFELDGTTGIANATVSFEGLDEFNRPQEYTFTTGNNGSYNGAMLAGDYTAMVVKEGYQPNEYTGTIHITYSQTTPNINFIIREVFDPVVEVIAEEVDDTQVKVYWSQGIMSEIMEDFETGDFSMFNWQNGDTYPWAITTTAYEGSYGMKSTNAGVNSTSSTIEVTVDINRDGLMSFYHKISSESNYDKGYFYIDDVEKMNPVSGNGNWQQKEFAITAGVHTFKWTYSKDSSVSSNDDCWYVDNISFVHDAEPVVPAEPGWVYYDNGENEDAIGTGGGQFSWGVMFPAGSYSGNSVTKVKAFDYMAMTGTVTIYNDGTSAPANAVGTTNITLTGSEDFVEVTFATPVAIDPTKNLWVILYNASGATYPAAVCANTGDANGRWVSIDGTTWEDLASYDLDYTFMVRAFVAAGKGEPQEIMVNNTHTGGTLANAGVAKGHGNRAFDHYNVYRAIEGDEANAELITSVTDTLYLDNDWATLAPGTYKWGVSRVYEGNRGNRDVLFTDNFESGTLDNWTLIDADGDGNPWTIATPAAYDIGNPYSGTYCASSWSWNNYSMDPDNYMISPVVNGASSITYYVATNTAYPDHYGIFASSNGTNASDFSLVYEETAPIAKDAVAGGEKVSTTKPGTRAIGPWTERNIDLPAGTKYVAFRHYNSYDMNYLFIDDVTIYGGGGDDPTPPTPPTADNESDIVWSNTIEHNMFVPVTITVTTNSGDAVTGATVTLTNTSEPNGNYNYNATLDETGTYAWENVRRGTYDLSINLEGFAPIAESVEIGDNANLNYTLVEILNPLGELYVSGTGWALFGNVPAPTPVDPDDPDDPDTPIEGASYDFEDGTMQGWTTIDADGDGFNWNMMSNFGTGYGHNGSTDGVYSQSYDNSYGILYPDNYFVSPQVTLGGSISFWACGQDASYVAEHFGVAVSTTTATASAFTTIQEWTMTAKGIGAPTNETRSGNRTQGTWHQYTVDLSAYAGQTGYVAIRHFNCSDMFYLDVDDITLGSSKGNRSIDHYNVKLDGVNEGSTVNPFFQHNVEGFEEGSTHTTSVQTVYTSGESEWTSFDWVYTSCENFDGLQGEPTALWEGENVVLNWVLPEGGDLPTPPDPQPTTVYDFEDGTMQGWTTIDADGDGFNWNMMSNFGTGYGHNGSIDGVYSQSYDNSYGILYPDNYLVSPQVTLGGNITFWACGQDASYVAEHFGVAVSTTTATASAFTTIQEWTMTAKGTGAPTNETRSGNRTQGTWHQYTVDLSTYAGQTGYVAIRHFNCSDMFYLDVDDIELGGGSGDTPTPPDPPVVGDTYDFEDGTMQGWTTIDADGDGFNWNMMSNFGTGYGHNGSIDGVYSQSYDNSYGILYPDNYFVSPQVTLGGSISFWACGQDASYVAEHFGVAVSTTTATASAFTTIQEWTMTAKGTGAPTNETRSGNRTQGTWHQYTVDLSAYAGQTGYVAIRHFNCSDMFYLDVDDISLGDSKATRDLTYDFEDGTMQGWTTIDADGDGFNWNMMSNFGTGYGHNGSTDGVYSQSYDNSYGILYPDNYLVSPQVTFDGSITFWACGQDASYVAEHFGVAVSTTTATASAFTTIQEWTMTAKGTGAPTNETRSGNRTQGTWHQYTVDLSAYAGQTGYVAIRHFNCSDMFYLDVDDIVIGGEGGDTPTPPDPPTSGDIYDFEDGTMQGWTSLDADGDGFGWNMMSNFGTGYGHNGSTDGVYSQSYDNSYGILYPDNYLVSPQVTLGGEIKFWACGQDASYVAEHFGVAVSTTTATASAFTTIQEWTMTAKGTGAPTNETRSGNRTQGTWHQYTVDLSAYAGQTGYVAIRHFNCSDMFYLDVDDIELGGNGDDPNPPVPPTPGANVRGVEIFRDGVWIAEVAAPAQTYTDIEPGEVGEYEIRVVYNGNTADYTHYTMSCPVSVVPQEIICIAPENLTGSYTYITNDNFGALINWTYAGEVETNMYAYDNGTYGTSVGAGEPFQWAVMFPAGTYTGSVVTKVATLDCYSPMDGSVAIYSGGSSAPGTMIATKDIQFTGAYSTSEEVDITFDEPVIVDPTQNLWVVFSNNSNGTIYPAAAGNDVTGDPNGRWCGLEGEWVDLAAAGLPGYCWYIHCYLSDLVLFDVYRNDEVIATVAYSDSEIQTYFDQVAIGNYRYQVKAVTADCESDFALTPDLSQDYVEINVTSVTENIDTRIYPNPTTGIVNIEAAGMNHITVVNTLGQVIYDANVNNDACQLNLGQYQAGVYMVRIATESGVSVKRVTVAK